MSKAFEIRKREAKKHLKHTRALLALIVVSWFVPVFLVVLWSDPKALILLFGSYALSSIAIDEVRYNPNKEAPRRLGFYTAPQLIGSTGVITLPRPDDPEWQYGLLPGERFGKTYLHPSGIALCRSGTGKVSLAVEGQIAFFDAPAGYCEEIKFAQETEAEAREARRKAEELEAFEERYLAKLLEG